MSLANPLLRKELRSMLREKRAWLVPMLYAGVLSAAAYLFFLPAREAGGVRAELGATLAGLVAVLQAVAICVFAPLVGAASVASERERGTWTRLLSSPAPRTWIATGKLVSSWAYVLVVCSVSLPVAALSWLYGGTDLASLAGLYLTHAILGITMASVGLLLSTLFSRTWTAALVSIAFALGLSVFTLAIFAAAGGFGGEESMRSLRFILYFNPGYGEFLFFAGDTELGLHRDWLWHYLAMASITLSATALAIARIRRLRD